jgi:hypothetical protein
MGCRHLKSWEFSNVNAKGTNRRSGALLLSALIVPLAYLLAAIGIVPGDAWAAIDPAKVTVELVARPGTASGPAQDFTVRDGGVLRSGDGVQLRLESDVDAYVYVIAYGSSHSAVLLHPFSARPDDAMIRKGQRALIPGSGVFLPLDSREGRETLFTIVSDVPLTDISDLLPRIEAHEGDLNAITDMLGAAYPSARRLSFKHIGAKPLVGVAVAAPRASPSEASSGFGTDNRGTEGKPDPVAGPSLLPPAGSGWSVPSTQGFGSGEASVTSETASTTSTSASAAAAPSTPNAAGNAQVSAPAREDPSAPVSSALRDAREAAGIDEHRFRGILATLPDGGQSGAPESIRKPFKEQGVLGAGGSRIRALEGAQVQSGASWPSDDGDSRNKLQN